MLFQRVIELTLTDDLLTGYPEKDLVGFTFDRQEKGPNAKAVAEAIWRFRPWGHMVRGAGWMDSSKIVPLQMADLVAYEIFRHHRDVTLRGGQERWQYKRLKPLFRGNEFHDGPWQEAILALNEQNLAKQREVLTSRSTEADQQ
jgi:hypothetical protein